MIKKIDDVIMISVKTILSQCVAEILSEYQAIIVTKVNYMWISERKLKQISVHSITFCKL